MVGENAVKKLNEGGGSSELKVKDMFSPLDAIREVYGAENVKYAEGYRSGRFQYDHEHLIPRPILDSLRNEAIAMAPDADVVIYIGGLNKNAFQDCESTDRYEYNLPGDRMPLSKDSWRRTPTWLLRMSPATPTRCHGSTRCPPCSSPGISAL